MLFPLVYGWETWAPKKCQLNDDVEGIQPIKSVASYLPGTRPIHGVSPMAQQ